MVGVRAIGGGRRRFACLAASLVVLTGCSGVPMTASDAIGRLEQLAAQPPSRRAGPDLPPPDPALAPIPPDDEDARIGLAELMRTWPVRIDAQASAGGTDEPDEPDEAGAGGGGSSRDRALRLYAEARQLDDAGERSRSISLLEQAAELEPGVPEIWRALGDARRHAGFDSSSGSAYLKAADLGLGEPEALTFAGLYALKRDEPERAAGYFIRALRAGVPHADPLVASVAGAHLGEVLLDLGRVRAGCEALRAGLDFPPAARGPTNMGDEASVVYRRRGPLSLRLGDGWFRLGEFGSAAEAYRLAAEIPTGNTPLVRTRLVSALRRAGRPAEAGLVLLEDLRNGSMLDADSLAALADVASRLSPRSLMADAIAGLDDGGSLSRRVNLWLARAAASDGRRARRVLDGALLDASASPTSAARRRLLSARLALEPPADRIGAVEALLRGRPSLAAASVSVLFDHDPVSLWDRIGAGVRDPSLRRALLGELALLLGDKDRIGSMLDGPADADPASLALRASLASAIGRWDEVDRSIGLLEGAPGGVTRDAALIRAYEASQRFDAALPVARRLADRGGASVDDLLRLSALRHLMGDENGAGDALDAALALDPADVRVYRALIAFFGPNGPTPDVDRTAEIGRSLREHLPSSRLLRQLVAGELLRRGLLDEAGDRVASLLREDPTDGGTIEAASAWWRLLAETDRTESIDPGTVREASAAHPASSGLVRLLAEGLVLLGRPDEALQEIDRYTARTGSAALRPLAERITREALDDPGAAAAMAEARIGPSRHSIDDSVDLAALRAGDLDGTPRTDGLVEGVLAALREIPSASMLTDRQHTALSEALGKVATHADRRRENRPEAFGSVAALGCFAWAVDRGLALAPATHALRLEMLVDAGADTGTIAAAASDAIDEYPGSAQGFARRLVDRLRGASRTDDAFGWIAGACFDDDGAPRPGVLNEWVRLVLLADSRSWAAAFIDTLEDRGVLAEAFELLRPRGEIWDSRDPSSPAEMAYLLAQYAVGSGIEGEHEMFLRLALGYDPRHPWAANDLGYTLLESGGSLEEAERLIEIAYAGLPDRPNVIDSLGWVRYHRGRLLDEPDGSGGVIEGAITLLGRAADLLGDEDSGTVHDHLGDALYAAGRTEDAGEAWHRAAMRANNALSRLRATGRAEGVRFRELQELATSAAMKRNALRMDLEPAVTPRRGAPAGASGMDGD